MTVELNIRIASSLAEIPAAVWDACAGASSTELSTRGQPPNPFVSHAFLSSLEQSKSVGARTGWQPQHLIAETVDGEVLGVAPCYAKSHSQGEYVFDHGWAEAFERAGGDYYPKLQVAVPFTPVTGPRLLARPGPVADSETSRAIGADGLARAPDVLDDVRNGRVRDVSVREPVTPLGAAQRHRNGHGLLLRCLHAAGCGDAT